MSDKFSKQLRTLLLITVILCPMMLWVTRDEWHNSLSQFAEATNQIWYNVMLSLASIFFFIHGTKRENWQDYVVGLGMAGILWTNVYYYPLAHTIVTGLTLAFAIFNLIYNVRKAYRDVNIFLGFIAILFFIVGYITSMHFYLGEAIALGALSIGMIRSVYNR